MASPFDSNKLLQRTPTKNSDEDLLLLTPKNNTDIQNPLKRPRENDDDSDDTHASEKSLQDILDAMYNMSVKLSNDIEKSKNELSYEVISTKAEVASMKEEIVDSLKIKIDSLEENLTELKDKVTAIEYKNTAIETRMDTIQNTSARNSKIINAMQQSKIDNSIEISGINQLLIQNSTNLKALVLSTILSFSIQINEDEIEKVYAKEINRAGNNGNDKILVVSFKDFGKKIIVMKAKQKVKDHRGIFFNISLTPSNRYHMAKAKSLAKPLNLKTFFSGGNVKVKKLDGTLMIIESAENLTELERYVATNALSQRQNNNATASSS